MFSLNPAGMYLDCGRKPKFPEKEHKMRLDVNTSLSFYDVFTFSEQTLVLPPQLALLFNPFLTPQLSF